jgi:hypothetical protein
MPEHLPKACIRNGCRNTSTDGTWVCASCKAADVERIRVQDVQRKQADLSGKLRAKRAWRDRLSPAVIAQNPICQRLCNGLQCRRPSSVVHHRIAPGADAHLFFSVYLDGVSQLIALCRDCHAEERDPKGTPGWCEGIHFVRTEFKPLGMLG